MAKKLKKKRKKQQKVSVEITRLNWDVEYFWDIINKKGFTITESATFQDQKKEKSLFGSRSPLYGTSFEDESAYIERFRCKCGAFKGYMFDGEICPLCKTPVESKDMDIKFTGWISLGSDFVINPYYYNKLIKVIGKKILPDIVKPKITIDVDGNAQGVNTELMEEKPSSEYYGIGLIEFRERYFEIMNHFRQKKKNKTEDIDLLIREASNVFCSKIPIYSTILRPESFTSDTYYFNPIDKEINPLFSLSEHLKIAEPIEKIGHLSKIQERLNRLWDKNFELIHGKDGFIREQILGGPLNFTSRNVIIPDPTLADDEVDLSYYTFRILYAYRIMYYLMKYDNISLFKAYEIWIASHKFDERVYEIMCHIVKEDEARVLINRNPTLDKFEVIKQILIAGTTSWVLVSV